VRGRRKEGKEDGRERGREGREGGREERKEGARARDAYDPGRVLIDLVPRSKYHRRAFSRNKKTDRQAPSPGGHLPP